MHLASGTKLQERVFDQYGRLVRYPLGAVVRNITYDAADRIVSYTHLDATTGQSTAAAQAMNQSFGYDELGRLTSIITPANSWAITYDANGNRTSVAINGASRGYTTATTSNRLTSISNPARGFGYDAAGNTLSDTGMAYTTTYRLDNRLGTLSRSGLTTTYQYDAGGQRVRKENSAGLRNFAYDQDGRLLGEYNATGPVQEYVWLGDTPVAVISGTVTAPLPLLVYTDHLNTPRVLVDKNDAARWRWISEPFGTGQPEPEPAPAGLAQVVFNLRFPGQFFDSESGLYYNYFRDYDGTTGRYVQSDLIGLSGGINTYGYVEANPVLGFDRFGLANGGWQPSPDLFKPRPFKPCSCGRVSTLLGIARAEDQKRDWSFAADRTDVNRGFGEDTYKCNLFADSMCEAANFYLPNIGGFRLQEGDGPYPPGVRNLSDPKYVVPYWPVVSGGAKRRFDCVWRACRDSDRT